MIMKLEGKRARMLWALLAIAAIAGASAGAAESKVKTPAWLAGKPLNVWFAIKGTAGAGGSRVNAYCGMTVKGSTSELFIAAAGGHAGGRDNRVVSIDLRADAPRWIQRHAPSKKTPPNVAYNPDGLPAARHTYQAMQYVAKQDRVMLFGVRYTDPGSHTYAHVDGFDLKKNKWDPAGTYPDIPKGGGYGVVSNSLTGDVWTQGLKKWTAATGKWSSPIKKRGGPGVRFPYAFDSKRGQIFGLNFGDGQGYGKKVISAVRVPVKGSASIRVTFKPGAALEQFKKDAPTYSGMDYDPDNDRFLFYCGQKKGAGRIFVIKPDAGNVWEMSLYVFGPGSTPPPAVKGAGINNRFRYLPQFKGFVLLHDGRRDLHFIRTAGPAKPSASSNAPAKASLPARKGPLAKLPSKPGAHIEKIKALGDDSWLNLGAPAADSKWGVARGRSWCPEMPYAPNLRGAFYAGEGRHGYVKPDGHYMDDFWFYDINAHAWICVYPGAKAGKDQGLTLGKDGLFRSADFNPLPVARMAHPYGSQAFDTSRGRLTFIPSWHGYAAAKLKQWNGLSAEAQKRQKQHCFSPWYLDAATGKFEIEEAKGPGVGANGRASTLVYLPTRKTFFFYHAGRCRFYDPAKRTWSKGPDKGGTANRECLSCYDSKRGRVYVAAGHYPRSDEIWYLDVATNKWVCVKAKGKGKMADQNAGALHYDSASDTLVLYAGIDKSPAKRGLFFLDAETGAWLDEKPRGMPKGWGSEWRFLSGAFYDARNNVHYFHHAGDSSDRKTEMWVYRYKRAKKEAPKKPAAKTPASAPVTQKLGSHVPAAAPRKRTPQQICTGWFSVAKNYKKVGMRNDARRCLDKIITAYPNTNWADRARKEMLR